jgi:hypothetical protein
MNYMSTVLSFFVVVFLRILAIFTRNRQEPLFLWRTFAEDRITLSEGGAVATQTMHGQWSLTTTEIELTEGRHFWEVELLSEDMDINVGISRPNLDPTGAYWQSECTDSWCIDAFDSSLCGNGKYGEDKAAGSYEQGDRVGMLLDLGNGSLRFFKNGVQHGPGYPAGSVTGPVVAAVCFCRVDNSVRLLPNAEAPAGVWLWGKCITGTNQHTLADSLHCALHFP